MVVQEVLNNIWISSNRVAKPKKKKTETKADPSDGLIRMVLDRWDMPRCQKRLIRHFYRLKGTLPQPQVSPIEDGPYTILARSSATDSSAPVLPPLSSDAVATVLIDRTPPSLNITQQPQPIQSDPSVTVRFGTNPPGDAASYVCRWGQETLFVGFGSGGV